MALLPSSASADPQVSVGLTLGGGAANLRTSPLGVFHMGVQGDVLFLRKRDRDMAIGPYAEVLTVAFETFEVGGGVSWLIPVTEHVPLVLSAGLFVEGRWGLGDGQQADILGGVQLDFELFALPFVLLYNAFR